MPKNEIVRRRGDYPGEGGADWSFGAGAKPEADEHWVGRQAGLRGVDKQQSALRDVGADEPTPAGRPASQPHPAAPPDGDRPAQEPPEGLRRPRQGPYNQNLGRNERATQVPQDPGPGRK